ncbi:MAG: tRNA pseudouridine(38-40) synthase TruA [Gammaproteobacteria bacterium]|nr:tRNA pseudouridine(38-40) synthase TruA [Gammaproteobacteria bacterium]
MRIALGIEYDGSQFSGWQQQKGDVRTVQGCLEQALSKIADQSIQVVCAGRTDTGVHALNQVVNFDFDQQRDPKAWVLGLNTYLPEDISALWVRDVPDDFSARFSAFERSYRYVIQHRIGRPALLNRRVSWRYGDLDIAKMHEAAQALLGEHDFSSFRSSQCQAKTATREMRSVSVTQQGDFIYIDVCANAFLHHQVRNIVGSLIEIGKTVKPVEWMAQLIAAKDRKQAGPTAPADGLYLVNVKYPAEYAIPECATPPVFSQ